MRFKNAIFAVLIVAALGANTAFAYLAVPLLDTLRNPAAAAAKNAAKNAEPTVDLGFGAQIPAQSAVQSLIAAFAIPEGWEVQGAVGSSPLTLPINVRCESSDPAAPAIVRTLSLVRTGTTASNFTGASIQARAYSPGWAPAVTENYRTVADKCGLIVRDLDGYDPAEAFVIEDDGAREGGGPSGATVVMRYGDVVGAVAVRGSDPNTLSSRWAQAWFAAWPQVLTANVCAQAQGTADDQKRSPLYPGYKMGWPRAVEVSLTPTQQLASDIAGRILIAPALTARFSGVSGTSLGSPVSGVPVIPTSALPRIELAQLPEEWPSELGFTVGRKPVQPTEEPEFPGDQMLTTTAAMPQPDPVGPGCGWSFFGMIAPPFEDKSAAEEAVRARTEALGNLMMSRGQSWSARMGYATEYATYASEASTWNAWVMQQARQLALVWWPWYDQQKAAYDTALAAYQTAVSEYSTVNPGCSIDGTVTTTSSGTAPVCPPVPTAPQAPKEPTVARP